MHVLRNAYVIGGATMLVLGSIGLGLYAVLGGNGASSEIFRFISLLIIFVAALASAATVFFGLNLANAQEAFGLPTGSVRALLAMGIMILFVVFGLPLTTAAPDAAERIADKPVGTSTIPPGLLQNEINAYRGQGLIVVIADPGRSPGADPVTSPGTPARVELYQKVRARPAEELEIGRQMLTAIVTLLTTVVGFYFGSRSASEGMREAEAARGATTAVTELSGARTQLAQEFTSLQSLIAASDGKLGDRRADPKTATNAGIPEAEKLQKQVRETAAEIEKAMAAGDAALAALSKARSPVERDQADKVAREQIDLARTRLAVLRDHQADYESKVNAIQ